MKCLECGKHFDINEHGQGKRKRCVECARIVRKEKQKMYSRDNYLRKRFIQIEM